MNSFYQNEGYAVPDASIRGGKVSIWQGGLGKVTDHETEAWIADGLRYGAQMFWNGKTPKADPDAQAFKARIDALGEPSTYTDPTRDTLTPGQYTITLADGQGLSVTGGTPVVGASSGNWEFVATPDGYYQIRSVNSNRCLAVYSEDTPNSETHVSTTPQPPGGRLRVRRCEPEVHPPRLRATTRRVTPRSGSQNPSATASVCVTP